MKILVFIPVWKRIEITKLCYESLKRTILNAPKDFSFVVLIVASNDKDADLASQYGFEVFRTENTPLGRKFNQGLEYGLDLGNWDYLMQINSDNVLSVDFWTLFEGKLNERRDFITISDIYIQSSTIKITKKFRYNGGCGIRFISREIIEKTGQLWDDRISRGLDNNSKDRIFKATKVMPWILPSNEPVVIDIKGSENIHPFSEFRLAPVVEYDKSKFPELNTAYAVSTEK